MIEHFTLDEFKEALPPQALHGGIDMGEHVFRIPLGDNCNLIIRSTIDESGCSADIGEDSIRLWLANQSDEPISSKKDAYTTRVSGWQRRLNEKIDYLVSLRQQALNCEFCNEPLLIFRVQKPGKNNGRLFASCANRDHKSFKWLNENQKSVSLDRFDWATGTILRTPLNDKKQPLPAHLTGESSYNPTLSPQTPSAKKSIFDQAEEEEFGRVLLDTPIRKIAPPDLSSLNEYQIKVVSNLCKGAHVTEACPGSGKTTLIRYLVSLMLNVGVHPSRIGCFTFSVKAAEELRTRIASTVWPDIGVEELAFFANPHLTIDDPELEFSFNREWIEADPVRVFLVDWVCTIHALSFRLLKAYGLKLKVANKRQESEINNLIKDSLDELDWDEAPKTIRYYISHGVNEYLSKDIFEGDTVQNRQRIEFIFNQLLISNGGTYEHLNDLVEIFVRYLKFMKRNDLVDFDMMQAMCARLLKTNAAFRISAQKMFDYIIVDEAQDTNDMQSEILFTLAEKCGNVLFVGDVDQSMYAFRGAVPEVLRSQFIAHWKDNKRFELPTNYRSTQSIIKLADKLIRSNYIDLEQYLKQFSWRSNAPVGVEPDYLETPDFDSLSDEVSNIIAQSQNPGDWFVLSRTRAECAAIHTRLIANKIPAINKSGGLLFGAPHIRKVLAYAQLGCNHDNARDNLDILKEIANVASASFAAPMTRRRHLDGCTNDKPWIDCGCPIVLQENYDISNTRFYGAKSIDQAGSWRGIVEQTYEKNRGGYPTLQSKGANDLVCFVRQIEKLKDNAQEALRLIIDDCVLPWLAHEEGISSDDLAEDSKIEDFQVLTSLIKPDQTLEEFLVDVDNLVNGSTEGNEKDAVLIGTVHWSKGAERPKVLVNMTRMPIVPPPVKPGHLPTGRPPTMEEERRLLFVAITRAKDECHLYRSRDWQGRDLGQSIFATELGFDSPA